MIASACSATVDDPLPLLSSPLAVLSDATSAMVQNELDRAKSVFEDGMRSMFCAAWRQTF